MYTKPFCAPVAKRIAERLDDAERKGQLSINTRSLKVPAPTSSALQKTVELFDRLDVAHRTPLEAVAERGPAAVPSSFE